MRTYVAYLFLVGCASAETGNKACASCHLEIYKIYQQTAMARSSGPVTRIENEGTFETGALGIRYLVYSEGGEAFFDFDQQDVHGRHRLDYFIGAGTFGRSYAFNFDGYLFQAPVAWYSARGAWDLSPGYERQRGLFLTRPVEPACLQCHASRLNNTVGTENGFGSPAFLEGGVSCERCHGSGDEHVRGKGKMVNPTKLSPDRRDSVCGQCHLSGEARVSRAGKENSFRPGERLSDYDVTLVWADARGETKVTTSHFEALQRSACKRASGDKLWCGTCREGRLLCGEMPDMPPTEPVRAWSGLLRLPHAQESRSGRAARGLYGPCHWQV